VLLARDRAAHVSLEDPGGVAALLDGLQKEGAHQQATALTARAAARLSFDNHEAGLFRS
jgi:hypothetical protein